MHYQTRRSKILNTLLTTRTVLGVLILLGITPSILSFLLNLINPDESIATWWEGWLQNFSTEMIGASVTFVLLELIIAERQRQSERRERMERQQVNDLAQLRNAQTTDDKQAILERMRTDNLLQNTDLSSLNLERVQLPGANFNGSDLTRTRLSYCGLENTTFDSAMLSRATISDSQLQSASFNGANLENAVLDYANLHIAQLENANLWGATLRYVDLTGANLRNANLWGADLRGARLLDADLRGANLKFTIMDGSTILPDGTTYKRQDMGKFTQSRNGIIPSSLREYIRIRVR